MSALSTDWIDDAEESPDETWIRPWENNTLICFARRPLEGLTWDSGWRHASPPAVGLRRKVKGFATSPFEVVAYDTAFTKRPGLYVTDLFRVHRRFVCVNEYPLCTPYFR